MTALTLADTLPATASGQTAGNSTLASILAQLQASRVETIWTDDTSAWFIRIDTGGAITWTTPTGTPSSGPGAGAKPVGGNGATSDTTRWQAIAALAGSYAIGDFLSHIVIIDAATKWVLGNFWINTTTGASLASAPSSASIAPLTPLPANAATESTLQLIKLALAGLLQAGGPVSVSNLPAVQPVSVAAVPLPNGAAKETGGNLDAIAAAQAVTNVKLATIASSSAAATSVPLTASITDASAYLLGPFIPQLAREIWLTLNATVMATGTATLLRSTDGGTTQVGLTAGGMAVGTYSFTAQIGAIANEIISVETVSGATYYLAIQLSAGAVTCLVNQ